MCHETKEQTDDSNLFKILLQVIFKLLSGKEGKYVCSFVGGEETYLYPECLNILGSILCWYSNVLSVILFRNRMIKKNNPSSTVVFDTFLHPVQYISSYAFFARGNLGISCIVLFLDYPYAAVGNVQVAIWQWS